MTGRVLIVDAVPTNRIILRVKLAAAFYDVIQAESGAAAQDLILRQKPDLVIASGDLPDMDSGAFCRELRDLEDGMRLPLMIVHGRDDPSLRAAWLASGADEVLVRPLDDMLLLARLRSLLRARDAAAELSLRDDTRRALGLSDPAEAFDAPANVALVDVGGHPERENVLDRLRARLPHRIDVMSPESALREAASRCDAIIVMESLKGDGAGLALLAQLRANTSTRHAALIYVAHQTQKRAVASALDIAAGDVLIGDFETEEMALRLERQIALKRMVDRSRAEMRDGLRAAMSDPLTGLYNRRYALPYLARISDRSDRGGLPYAVLLIDLDHFKTVNDTYGHAAGDAVLVAIAARLRDKLRATDLVARIGGEEFLVALPCTPRSRAQDLAQDLCDAVAMQPVLLPGGECVPVTVSIGVAIGEPGDTRLPNDLLQQADEALYQAKADGRNAVVMAGAAKGWPRGTAPQGELLPPGGLDLRRAARG